MQVIRTSLALLVSALAATCVPAYRPGDQICSYASGTTCPIDSLTLSRVDGSALIYPGGKTRCAFDDFEDPATNFTANATFFFQVFPKPERKKLMIGLQGGGACIDEQTCNFALQCSLGRGTFFTVAQAASTGVLNGTDPKNPFRDWNIVHVPYCTGDLHIGNRVLPAKETGLEALLGRSECLNRSHTMHISGLANTKAAVDWARTNFPDVDEIVLGGVSAGALGTQALANYVADVFQVEARNVRYSLLPDSYVGVLPVETSAAEVLKFYGTCDTDIKVPSEVITTCKSGNGSITDLIVPIIKSLPQSKWLFISSYADKTQRYFYQLAKEGLLGFPFPNLISEDAFYQEMIKILNVYRNVTDRVSTFLIKGDEHVFLVSDTYYDTLSDTGERLGDYIRAWLQPSNTSETTTPSVTVPAPVSASHRLWSSCMMGMLVVLVLHVLL